MRVFDTDLEKNAEELQAEGRAMAARGWYVYVVHPEQIPIMLEFQIPFILSEPIPAADPERPEREGPPRS